ncbi:nitrilase-related carbon-nitrogen hydrolase [Bounagaea algeriensis]
MRVALAQTNCVLGDVRANLDEAHRMVRDAAAEGADLVVFPELSLHGYALGRVPGDRSVGMADERLADLSRHGPDVLLGAHESGSVRRFNAAGYFTGGALLHNHRKLYLVNYLDWEERKHAAPGRSLRAYDTPHGRMATLICNDAWQPPLPWLAAQDGAEVLLIPTNSATPLPSPAEEAPAGQGSAEGGAVDTVAYWRELLLFIARMQQCWVVFVNRVGEESGVSFWGGSRVVAPSGEVVAEAPLREPFLTTVDIDVAQARRRRRELPLLQEARFELLAREARRLADEGAD